MIDSDNGILFQGLDGSLILATYDEYNSDWLVSEVQLEFVATIIHNSTNWPKSKNLAIALASTRH
jgi:hypothetical protein